MPRKPSRPLRWDALQIAALVVAPVIAFGGAAFAQNGSPLPGGASSLTETFDDWTVSCRIAQAARRCALAQQKVQQNGQRIWALEVRPAPDGAVTGILGLLFGLRLADGVGLAINDKPTGVAPRFSTCLPAGCMVSVELNKAIVSALRSGKVLKVGAVANNTGAPLSISISLKGFAASLDRTAALLR